MEIHNRAEEAVVAFVNDIFDSEEKKKELGYCTCYQCRLDVSCYVLNRVTPEYVISQRGLAHGENDYLDRLQRKADLVTLIKEGMERIDQTKRPHFAHGNKSEAAMKPLLPSPPVFNYPTLMGRLFNGVNFEPLSGMSVSLRRTTGELVPMIDPNWQNPCTLVSNTAGTFLFWPLPEKAPKVGAEKVADLEVLVQAPGFEELRHFISIPLKAEDRVEDSLSSQRTFAMKDLYLFPK